MRYLETEYVVGTNVSYQYYSQEVRGEDGTLKIEYYVRECRTDGVCRAPKKIQLDRATADNWTYKRVLRNLGKASAERWLARLNRRRERKARNLQAQQMIESFEAEIASSRGRSDEIAREIDEWL